MTGQEAINAAEKALALADTGADWWISRDMIQTLCSEIARLRALLKGALVPCPRCQGLAGTLECGDCHGKSPVAGWVSVEVKP
jgi:hypothetical protein